MILSTMVAMPALSAGSMYVPSAETAPQKCPKMQGQAFVGQPWRELGRHHVRAELSQRCVGIKRESFRGGISSFGKEVSFHTRAGHGVPLLAETGHDAPERVVHVKHPELFSAWKSDVYDPKFLELMDEITKGANMEALLKKNLLHTEVDGVMSFPVFNFEFCDKFLEEVDNYYASGLPIRRPNSMNKYGLTVNEIGLEPSITHFQQHYILPLAKLLYPKQGAAFHTHHSFTVEYKAGHDVGLDMHSDDSDVTLNVCLGREFKGAGLTFCGQLGKPNHRQFSTQYQHKRGRAVIHLGSKRHGADDITHGERNNLIIWNYNLDYRQTDDYLQTDYVKEEAAPDTRCLSCTYDRDYEAFLDVPAGRKRPEDGGWCPPEQFCYDRMEPIPLRVSQRTSGEP